MITSVTTVLDQHAEEASFLFSLRSLSVHEPHHTLDSILTLDLRLQGNLEGLLLAGKQNQDNLLHQLDGESHAEIFIVSAIAFELSDSAAVAQLAEHVRRHPESTTFMAAALGWLDWPLIAPWIDRLLVSPEPIFRRIGLAACGMHRHDPGPALLAGLSHADPGVLARAARVAGELRRRDLMAAIRAHRLHPNAATRFWANWTTVQMGDEEALAPLRQFAEQPGALQYRALLVLLAWQPRDISIAWVRQLMPQAQQRRMVIQAVGLLGDPVSLPWLIQQMHDLPHARIAGEAFSLITGADLALLDLELRDSPDYDAGPNDDPADPNVAMDDDENLPWPDPALIEAWWQQEKVAYQNGQGYFLGQPISEQGYRLALSKGQQRQRIVAAYGLARFRPTEPLFPTSAPAWRQQRLLAEMS